MFSATFEKLLGTSEFFSHGDALGFGLRHLYQVRSGSEHVYDVKETTRQYVQGASMRLGSGLQ